jgi:hypothetical protein
MITVYKITIVGYVTDQDFGGTPCTPAAWPLEEIVKEMGANVSITQTLLDTIDEDATNEGTLPGYCGRCIQERLASDVDYGQVFESFRAVSSDDCDSCAKLNTWEDDLTAPAQAATRTEVE